MNGRSMKMRALLTASTCVISVLLLTTGVFAQSPSEPAPPKLANKSATPAKTPTQEKFHEDWNSITLAGSHLTPQLPLLGEKDNAPEAKYIRELFQLQWRPYDPLDLYVVLPKGVTNPPVILYLYSFPQDTDRFKDDLWCTTVTSDGYAAVGFVSALTGHRAVGSHPMRQWFVSELQESLVTSTHDVQMILDFLAERKEVDMDHVGMFGQGSGGTIAMLASAADARIKVVDVLTPWGDWPNWLAKSAVVPPEERGRYTTPEFLARVAHLDPVTRMMEMRAQRIRIQNVRKDPAMPDDSQVKIETAAPEIAAINQYGDGGALVPKAAGGRLFDWIKAQLNPIAVSATAEGKPERIHFYPETSKHDSLH